MNNPIEQLPNGDFRVLPEKLSREEREHKERYAHSKGWRKRQITDKLDKQDIEDGND